MAPRPVSLKTLAALAGTALSATASAQSLVGTTFNYELLGASFPNTSGTATVGTGAEFTFSTISATYTVDVDGTGVSISASFHNTVPGNIENWGTVNGINTGALRLSGLNVGCQRDIVDVTASGTAIGGANDVVFTGDTVQVGEFLNRGTNQITWSHGDTFRVNFISEDVGWGDPSYSNVYDLPTDTLPTSVPGSSQVNVMSGGRIDQVTFGASDGSTCDVQVNMFDGGAGKIVAIERGAQLNMFEGSHIENLNGDVTRTLRVGAGGEFNLLGGRVESPFEVEDGGVANIVSGELGARRLTAAQHQIHINGVMNLSGGYVANYTLIGGTLNISGGEIDSRLQQRNIHFTDSPTGAMPVINMSGGKMTGLDIGGPPDDGRIVMTGGVMDEAYIRPSMSTYVYVDMLGGTWSSPTLSTTGTISIVNDDPLRFTMAGGRVIDAWMARGTYYVRGGSFNWAWLRPSGAATLRQDGTFIFYGERFAIDGVAVSGLNADGDRVAIDVPSGSVFSGVLEDGTPFAWLNEDDRMENMDVFAERSPIEDRSYVAWNDGDREYGGITDGRTLELQSGTMPEYFKVENATLHLNGGDLAGRLLASSGAEIIIDQGSIGSGAVMIDSTITVRGGSLTQGEAFGSTTINAQGGTLRDLSMYGPVTGTMTGGVVNLLFRSSASIVQSAGNFAAIIWNGGDIEQSGGRQNLAMNGGTNGGTFTRTGGFGDYIITSGIDAVFGTGGETRITIENGAEAVITGGDAWHDDIELCIGDDNCETIEDPGLTLAGHQIDGFLLSEFTLDDLTSTVAQLHVTNITIDGVDYTHLLQEDTPVSVPLVPQWLLPSISFTPPSPPTGMPVTGRIEATLLDGQLLRTRLGAQFGTLEIVLDAVPNNASCNAADVADPFGVLDLTDINVFTAALLRQDDNADLNDDGVWDLSDINLFTTAFAAGCPS